MQADAVTNTETFNCPTCASMRESLSSLPNRIATFARENKGVFFLGCTVVLALGMVPFVATTEVITLSLLTTSFVSGILSACSVHIFFLFFCHSKLMDKNFGEPLAALIGVANLCLLYLNPISGIYFTLYDAGLGITSYVIRTMLPPPSGASG